MKPEEVLRLIQEIAVALGPTASEAWDIFVRQQIVEGAVSLFVGLAASAIVYVLYQMIWKLNDPDKVVAIVVLALFGLPAPVWLIANGIMHLSNPAFFAIRAFIGG